MDRSWEYTKAAETPEWYTVLGWRNDEQGFYAQVKKDRTGYKDYAVGLLNSYLDPRCTCGLPARECAFHADIYKEQAVMKNWTAENPLAFAHRLVFDIVAQLKSFVAETSKQILRDEEMGTTMVSLDSVRAMTQRMALEDKIEAKKSRVRLVDIAEWCQVAKLKAAVLLYEDGDPENGNGLILPQVFLECWKRMGCPKNMFDLEKRDEAIREVSFRADADRQRIEELGGEIR